MDSRRVSAGLLTLGAIAAAATVGSAQSYDDLRLVRDRPLAYTSLLQVRAGLLGGLTTDSDEARSLENELGWDGHVYYHRENLAQREAELDLYAGRDGAYAGLAEGNLLGGEARSRLELFGRYFPFYRQGFYRGGDFIPTGQYRGFDYGVALSIGRAAGKGGLIDGGVFYRRNEFSRTDQTASNFTIPDDYSAYGFRTTFEHNTLVLDRVTTRPDAGFLVTVAVEWERNDSDRLFGVAGVFESTLPSSVWRGLGHAEFYAPQSEATTWEILIDAQVADDQDRVFIYDAQKPIGQIWVDGSLGFRVELGRAFWVTPRLRGQYVRALEETGGSSDDELFWGGGADLGFDLGDDFTILGSYSYLTNQSRPPVSTRDDTFAEQRFFIGLEARFGAVRR